MPDIKDLFKFLDHMRRFQAVIRKIRLHDREAEENDAEHSYVLAMCAWYLNSAYKLGYDPAKLVFYALVHDLPEIYALDVHIGDEEGRKNKLAKEGESIAQFQTELTEFPELFRWIHGYELRLDLESQFVYQLDKLIPSMIVFQEGGTTWRELNFMLDWLNDFRRGKINTEPTLMALNEQLEALINTSPGLFNSPSQKKLKVYVASKSPFKVQAVLDAIWEFYQVSEKMVEIRSLEMRNGLGKHPDSIDETKRGAKNRLAGLWGTYRDGDLYIAIQGGDAIIDYKRFVFHWLEVIDSKGHSVSMPGTFVPVGGLIPSLGILADMRKNPRHEAFVLADNYDGGYAGLLTGDKITGQRSYRSSLVLAFGVLRAQQLTPLGLAD